MVIVKKASRVLKIEDTEKDFYLNDGYDVVELNADKKEYEVIEAATGGKTYTTAEYNAIKAELDAALKELEEIKGVALDRDVIKAELDAIGIGYAENARTTTLAKLLDDAKAGE